MTADRDPALPTSPRPTPPGAPWSSVWRSDLRTHGATPLAQAANVDPDGMPDVRTVVVRGISADGCPVFTTDVRSAKVRAVHAGSDVALCVWWSEPGVQVRLRGPASLVTGPEGAWGEGRARLWTMHREAERRGFSGPPPGTLRDPGESVPPMPREDARPADAPAEGTPHPNFGLVIVTPYRFDRLVLGDPHVRTTYDWDEAVGWRGGRVVP